MKFHVSFILLCLLASEMAHAGSCSDQQREKLQSKVVDACKTTSMRCLGTDNKATLNSKISQFSACINARKTINDTCFDGGDPGHKQAIIEVTNGRSNCQTLLSNVK